MSGTIGRTRFARAVVAGMFAGALVLAGCSGPDAADRHGAGAKLTESEQRDGQAGGRNDRPDGNGASSDRADGADGSNGEAPAGGSELVGKRLPDLELSWLRPEGGVGEDAGKAKPGDPVRLRALHGEPLVINVWAAWCTPCRDEMPYFQQLSQQAGDRLQVVGVDHADEPQAATALLDELQVDYPQLADPDEKLRAPFGLGVGIPVTVYVAPDGEVVHVARTPYQSVQQLRSDVDRYLDVSP